MNISIAACLCVRNCSAYLPKIFENLDILGAEFKNFYIIFVYDNCDDNSEHLLEEYKKTSPYNVFLINNEGNNSPHRTVRIANSRNKCLDVIYNVICNVDYHIMIDSDDVNKNSWNINLIKHYLITDTWDSISFNRDDYYDIWALQYGKYKYHCWGYGDWYASINNDNLLVVNHMKREITDILNNLDTDLFECYSAFNGLAIYRTPVFKNIIYDGFYNTTKQYISDEDRNTCIDYLSNILNTKLIAVETVENCEHINYYLSAIRMNNARIRISKYKL
jgi:hypothetical protein